MGFLDDLGAKGKELSDKAKSATDIASMNSSISKMEKLQCELYTALGKEYYSKYGHGVAPEFLEYVEQIDRLNSEIERANRYVSDMRTRNGFASPRNTKTCPECGKVLESSASFCSNCGADVKDVLTNDSMHATITRTNQPDASVMVKKVDQHVSFMDDKLRKLEEELQN